MSTNRGEGREATRTPSGNYSAQAWAELVMCTLCFQGFTHLTEYSDVFLFQGEQLQVDGLLS